MIKTEIDRINEIIIDSEFIERYGMYCTHKTDAKNGIPYGYGKEKDCKGNTYSFDERIETVAYLSLVNFQTRQLNRMANYLDITFQLHHFANQKKINDDKYYGKGFELYALLFREIQEKFKFNPSVLMKLESKGLPDNCEYTIFDIKITTVVPCDYQPEIDPVVC